MIVCHEREIRNCCLKIYKVIYFSNVWWDHIPDANSSGVKGEYYSSIDADGEEDEKDDKNRNHGQPLLGRQGCQKENNSI